MSAAGGTDPRAVALFGPIRRMDQIDAAREVSAWLEATALSLPRIPNEEIKTEREDFGVRVYWRDNRPHAVMLTIRDGLNFTFGVGFDLSALAAAQERTAAAEARAEAAERRVESARTLVEDFQRRCSVLSFSDLVDDFATEVCGLLSARALQPETRS